MSGNRIKYTYQNLRNILDENNINLVEFQNRQHIIKSVRDHTRKILRDKDGYYTQNDQGVKQYLFDKEKYGLMPNWCPECGHIMGRNRLDQYYWPIHKRCFKCSIKLQTQMKLDGVWEEYEKRYMMSKIISTCDEAVEFYQDLKEHSNREILLNEQGDTESWDIIDIQSFNNKIDELIQQIKVYKQNSIKSIQQEINSINEENVEEQFLQQEIFTSDIDDDNINNISSD